MPIYETDLDGVPFVETDSGLQKDMYIDIYDNEIGHSQPYIVKDIVKRKKNKNLISLKPIKIKSSHVRYPIYTFKNKKDGTNELKEVSLHDNELEVMQELSRLRNLNDGIDYFRR